MFPREKTEGKVKRRSSRTLAVRVHGTRVSLTFPKSEMENSERIIALSISRLANRRLTDRTVILPDAADAPLGIASVGGGA